MGKNGSYFGGRGNGTQFGTASDINNERRSNGSGGYMEASSKMEDAVSLKEKAIKSAGDAIATYAATKNQNGETNVKGTKEELTKLLKGFTIEEQNVILKNAIAALIVNL